MSQSWLPWGASLGFMPLRLSWEAKFQPWDKDSYPRVENLVSKATSEHTEIIWLRPWVALQTWASLPPSQKIASCTRTPPPQTMLDSTLGFEAYLVAHKHLLGKWAARRQNSTPSELRMGSGLCGWVCGAASQGNMKHIMYMLQ